MRKRWTFFEESEVVGIEPELVAKLDWARGRSGVPFTITSGARAEDQNESAGGVKDSAHLRGLAVDLRVSDPEIRFKMVNALLLAGFKRIGIYDRHVHCDMDASLPQYVMWVGISH